ncbi:MAG: FKBP-type peptidyl-prolyl cis-trans isomerase, partial [Rhodocyclaceae bacterium]
MTQVTTASGLVIEDLEVGTGAEATDGQHVQVHYTG